MATPQKPILVVEDDANDLLFLKMALESIGVANPIVEARDGRQAQNYLSSPNQLPYLLLLDLKLPQLMGLDLLKWIRERPQFDCLIVVVLTSSSNPADVDNAYRLGANAYLVKPSGFQQLQALAKSIQEFWLRHNQPGTPFLE